MERLSDGQVSGGGAYAYQKNRKKRLYRSLYVAMTIPVIPETCYTVTSKNAADIYGVSICCLFVSSNRKNL